MKNDKNISPGEIIKRYVNEVGRYLPKKDRRDICRELYSSLTDMLEDRGAEDVFDFLKEQGTPRKKAATYYTHQYLIGPELFPAFRTVTGIVIPVIAAVLAGTLTITGIFSPEEYTGTGEFILEVFGSTFSGTASAFGFIVLIFFFLQRHGGHGEKLSKDLETWHPKDLLAKGEAKEFALGEQIVRIVFSVFLILLVNWHYDSIGNIISSQDITIIVPSFSDSFIRFLPAVNTLWGLTIGLSVVLIISRKVNYFSRIADYGLKGYTIALAIALLNIERLFTVPALSASAAMSAETAAFIVAILNNVMKGIFVLVIVLTIIDIVKSFVKRGKTADYLE